MSLIAGPAFDYVTADVFTDVPFAGNQLAVLTVATGLSDAAMQQIAQEFDYPETVFVLPPEDPKHTAKVRIFTPAYEMPFAGHPTLGTAAILKAMGRSDPGADGRVTLEEQAGDVPVQVSSDGDGWTCEFVSPQAPRLLQHGVSSDGLASALSISASEVSAICAASAGAPFLYAELTAPSVVTSAAVATNAWNALPDRGSLTGVYLYARDDTGGWFARMFAPDAGVAEDPATGSAVAALPAALCNSAQRPNGVHTWSVRQGVDMGRPSTLHVKSMIRDNTPLQSSVGGSVRLIAEGKMSAPPSGS